MRQHWKHSIGLARQLRIICASLYQKRRNQDGVRGLFTSARFNRGDDLVVIPYQSCFAASPSSSTTTKGSKQQPLRTSSALYPIVAQWERRIGSSSAGRDANKNHNNDDDWPTVQLECSLSTENETIHLQLHPFEAALTTAAANRFFFSQVIGLQNYVEWYDAPHRGQKRSPIASTAAEARYLESLTTDTILQRGTEAPQFLSALAGDSAQDLHSGIEMLAGSLKDYFMNWVATDGDRRVVEGNEELYQQVMIAAMYAVRSRVLRLERISVKRGRKKVSVEKELAVIAPILDMINHGLDSATVNCAAVAIDEEQCIKVRATRSLLKGEELLISYIDPSCLGKRNHVQQESIDSRYFGAERRTPQEILARNQALAWESRYLFANS